MPKLIVKDLDRAFLVDLRPGESVVLGRARECDVPLETPLASRRHAEIAAHDAGFQVQDLGSTNGTSVNGVRLLAPVPLSDGDVIQVGDARVVFRSRP